MVSKLAAYGAVRSVAIWVHVPAPSRLRSKTTWAVSGADAAVRLIEPATFAPGSANETAGGLSTITLRRADVSELVAASMTTTLSSALPSAALEESQLAWYGAVVSVEIDVKLGAPLGRTKNSTEVTPDGTSLAAAVTGTTPLTRRPSVGVVTEPVGSVVSMRTVAECRSSVLPALSAERYSIVWAPSFEWSAGAGIRTDVPFWKRPPSTRYSVEAMPESASLAVSVTVTADVRQPAGASSVVSGSVVSMRTVAERRVSTLPALSVERYSTVCTPSFEWSAGAGIETVAPLWKELPSTRYCVEARPEPVSVTLRFTVTAELPQPAGASSVVTGLVVSTLASALCAEGLDWLPTLSETEYW